MAPGAILIAIIALVVAWRAHLRVRRLTLRRGDSLEDTLGEMSRRVKEFQQFREELEAYLKNAEGRLQKSLRGLGVVRFNPFEGDGSGGNQSFSAAFLDEKGDGVVLSALYARSGQTSMFAKPLEKSTSTFELSDEERQAIQKANESLKTKAVEKK